MNQVNYASEIVPLLEQETDEKLLTDMISAQLSHSNGIRGFFVSYLTGGDVSVADDENMPQPLRTAIAQNLNANKKELISLSCMNVIMPTGMITMHTDEEMSKNSAKTAARGKIVARAMMEEDEMKEQCLAILAVATDKTHGCDEKRVKVRRTTLLFWRRKLYWHTLCTAGKGNPCKRNRHQHSDSLKFVVLHIFTSTGRRSLRSGVMEPSKRRILLQHSRPFFPHEL